MVKVAVIFTRYSTNFPQGVTKTYRLTYEPAEVISAVFNKEGARNRWTIGAEALKTFVEYFGAGTEQLDFWVENGRVTFTSYTDKVVNGRGKVSFSIYLSIYPSIRQAGILTQNRRLEATSAHFRRH